jgi:serine/threonine protein kinase
MSQKSSVEGTQVFMPPESLVESPKYSEKLDVFSYANILITTTTHIWPNPGQPTKLEGKKLIRVSELQQHQQYVHQFTSKESELFLPVARAYLQNDPSECPTSIQLVTQMSKIEEAHPRVPESVVIGQLCPAVVENNALLVQKDAQFQESHRQLHVKDCKEDVHLCLFQEEMKQLRQEAPLVKKVSVHCLGMAYSPVNRLVFMGVLINTCH